METKIEEIWTDVTGYEGLYSVSNYGRVKSQKGKYLSLKPHITKGYVTLSLKRHGEMSKFASLHRLVAYHFIPIPKTIKGNNLCVNHINGIKTDNHVENLEWCTHRENMTHAYKNGLIKKPVNTLNFKLTLDQVIEIKKLQQMDIPNASIAKMYGMSPEQIQNIKKRPWGQLQNIYKSIS